MQKIMKFLLNAAEGPRPLTSHHPPATHSLSQMCIFIFSWAENIQCVQDLDRIKQQQPHHTSSGYWSFKEQTKPSVRTTENEYVAEQKAPLLWQDKGHRYNCPASSSTSSLSLNTLPHFDGEPVSGTSLGRQRVTSIQSDIPPIDLGCHIPPEMDV